MINKDDRAETWGQDNWSLQRSVYDTDTTDIGQSDRLCQCFADDRLTSSNLVEPMIISSDKSTCIHLT